MERQLRRWVVLALCLLPGLVYGEPYPFDELSFEEAVQKATREKKPILVKVFATWCGPCKRMEKEVFESEAMQQFAPRIIALKMDGDSEAGKEFNARFGVTKYPTNLFLNSQGEEVHRAIGMRPKAQFLTLVDAHISGRLFADGVAPAVRPFDQQYRETFERVYGGKGNLEDTRWARESTETIPEEDRTRLLYLEGEWIHRRNGAKAKAVQALGKAVSGGAESIAILPRALAFHSQGKGKQGQKILMQSLRNGKTEKEKLLAALRVARFWAETRQKPSASDFDMLVGLALGSERNEAIPLLNELATVSMGLKKAEMARQFLQRACALRPAHPWYAERLRNLDRPVP